MLDDLRDQGYGLFATRAPRTRAEPIMHENNGSRLKVRSYTGEHLRNVVPTPIVGISGPGDELESEVLRHGLSTWRDGPQGVRHRLGNTPSSRRVRRPSRASTSISARVSSVCRRCLEQ